MAGGRTTRGSPEGVEVGSSRHGAQSFACYAPTDAGWSLDDYAYDPVAGEVVSRAKIAKRGQGATNAAGEAGAGAGASGSSEPENRREGSKRARRPPGGLATVEASGAYTTAVDQPSAWVMDTATVRVRPGNPEGSTLFRRMGLRDMGGEEALGQLSAGLSLRPMRSQRLQFHYAYSTDPIIGVDARTTVGLEVSF